MFFTIRCRARREFRDEKGNYPRWFYSLFNLPDEKQHCLKHRGPKTLSSFYCLDCCSRICGKCCTEDHRSHEKFQLWISTRCLTIRSKDLSKRGIQLDDVFSCICNSQEVTFIFSRHPPLQNRSSRPCCCVVCGHRFKCDNIKYCSLKCLVLGRGRKLHAPNPSDSMQNEGGQQEGAPAAEEKQEREPPLGPPGGIDDVPGRRRLRSRKQRFPRKAPLYSDTPGWLLQPPHWCSF